MEILDGKKLSQQIKEEIKQAVDLRKEKGQKIPHLAAVLVGNDGASLTYVGSKVRSCEQVGFKSTLIRLESSISEEALLSKIKALNNDDTLDGYIVQLPLPKHIDEEKILLAVDPKKRRGWLSSQQLWSYGSRNGVIYTCDTLRHHGDVEKERARHLWKTLCGDW